MPTGDRRLDEFESMFRSAVKDRFKLDRPKLQSVLIVGDGDRHATDLTRASVERMLATIDRASEMSWSVLSREDWVDGHSEPITTLIKRINEHAPDLVVTHRHLLGRAKNLPHTLGSVVDSVTQATSAAVLLLPPSGPLPTGTGRVMAVTDHITGDDRLVSWGVHFTQNDGGTLYLAHIEDDTTLDYYLDVIGKLPMLDSDVAKKELPRKLLELPSDYLQTIAEELERNGVRENIVPVVRMGHALTDYKALMTDFEIDLLIVNTKDPSQLAMHALAHALAVEIRHRPLLLL